MDEREISRKLSTEHKRVAALASALRDTIDDRPPPVCSKWLNSLQEAFFAFRAHMTHRVALTEVGGLYKELVEARPSVANDVGELRNEQRDILARIEGIQGALRGITAADYNNTDALVPQIKQILGEVDRITDRENNLVSFVHTQDVGGENG